MKKKFNLVLLASLFFMTMVGFIIPETEWEVVSVNDMTTHIKDIEGFYKNTTAYSIKMTHKTFKNYTTSTVEDQANGFFIKDSKNNYQSYSMGIRTIQNSKIKITIDSVNNSILINEPDKQFTKEVKVSELKDLLKICTKIKMKSTEENDKFRFEFDKNNTYSAYEIWTNSTHQIKKMVIFFNAELPSDPNDEKSVKTKPRAEIIFSNYKTGISPVYKDYFDETKYILLKNGEYVATEKFKNYLVYDLRVKN